MKTKILLASALFAAAGAASAQTPSSPHTQQSVVAAPVQHTVIHGSENEVLNRVLADATTRYPGQVTDVELDDGRYEIDIRPATGGRKIELEYSAQDGRLLKVDTD